MKATIPCLALLVLIVSAGSCKDAVAPEVTEPPALSDLQGTIVFLSDREFGDTPIGPGRTELYAILPDGSGERQLTDNDVVDNISAMTSVHPSGRSVLIERFVDTAPGPTVDIVSVDIDGTITPLTHNLETGYQDDWPTAARWSPDGTRILASIVTPGEVALYEYAADGSSRSPFFPTSTWIDYHTWWSPRGDWISLMATPDWSFPWRCEVARADGTDRHTIAADELCDEMAWAPDGSRVFFSSGPASRHFSIWQSNPDGSNPQRIIEAGAGVDLFHPRLSPDGTTLAFVVVNGLGEGDVFIADPDGTDTRPLVTSPGDDNNPVYSPDGSWIAFQSDRYGPTELMLVPVAGGEPVRLTSSGYNRYPFWLSER